MTRVGIISDTHGVLRVEALDALAGCAHIVHAGDIGKPEVISALQAIAPVTAVRGNHDKEPWAFAIPESDLFQIGACFIYLIHDLKDMDIDPVAAGVSLVISGHTHQPRIEQRGSVLYVNPGSAGPRRFSLPVSIAIAEVTQTPMVRLVELSPKSGAVT